VLILLGLGPTKRRSAAFMSEVVLIETVRRPAGRAWQEVLRIYRAAFPTWEREPEWMLANRINEGRYLLKVAQHKESVIGFYILDLVPPERYTLLAFVAVMEGERNKGIGSKLCAEAVATFRALGAYRWLLVEAQDRQGEFYGRFGFRRLALDYRVPRFDGAGTETMHLMAIPADSDVASIAGSELAQIVRHIFTSGYSLDPSDPRLAAQLTKIGSVVTFTVRSGGPQTHAQVRTGRQRIGRGGAQD
jgi:predicted N-acetyltransferase YhbS